MFCPRCGKPMTIVDGTFKCVPGEMPLSKAVHDGMTEVFVTHDRHARPRPFRWGGRWFCPGCGIPAMTSDEHVQCEKCDEYLDEFIRPLVERHPHR